MKRFGPSLFLGVGLAGVAHAVPAKPFVAEVNPLVSSTGYVGMFKIQSPFDFTKLLKNIFRQGAAEPLAPQESPTRVLSVPSRKGVPSGDILTPELKRSLSRGVKRVRTPNPEDLSPEEEAEREQLNEAYANFASTSSGAHGSPDLTQTTDTQGPLPRFIDQSLAKIFPRRSPKLKLASGEWADTIDVVDYLYDRLKDGRVQMSKAHPKTYKQLSDLCDLDVQIAKAERDGDGAAAQRADQAKSRLRASVQPDVKRWFTARYGPTVAAAEMKRPMRAMSIYLLHALSDTDEVIPGLSIRDLAAVAPTLNGEARNLDCPTTTKNKNAAAAEIRASFTRRSKNEGRALNAKEKQTLASLGSDIDKPWWAEPCRKSQMELVGQTMLNRLEASKKNAAVEGMFLFPRQAATKTPVRNPAGSPQKAPEFSPYRSVIESGSFSMWNEHGNSGGQGVACLMTGKGNYASEHQMKSALFAIRNLYARNAQGKPFLRGEPTPLPSGLQYFAMPAYSGKIPGRALPRTVLTEGPPPANPRLGQVSISGSSYGIVGGPSGTQPGHIFKVD